MPKRYIMKVELEFECPATVPPNEAFYRYWYANRKVEKDNCKVLESKVVTTPAKVNEAARAHNERRRILQTMIDQCDFQVKIIRGFRSRHVKGRSTFQISCSEINARHDRSWIVVEGATILFNNEKLAFNLADPNIHIEIVKVLRCHFHLCNHQNKSAHI